MINRVGEFEKVSFEEFYKAMKDCFYESDPPEDEIRVLYDAIKLPERATEGSAGYDFKAPMNFVVGDKTSLKIPTGVRVKIKPGWWLACLPRSGLGFKYGFHLKNTCGVIDSDYYYSDNEGHIFAKVSMDSGRDKVLSIKKGDGFLQAIFLPYGITYTDNASGVRNGGMGSTDRKEP